MTEPSRAEKHGGRYYWCVKTDLSEDGEVYAFADEAAVASGGDLLLIRRRKDEDPITMLAFARNHWRCFFSASVMDGSPVSVMHWKGEIVESRHRDEDD